jgi:hypothetical protein
MLIYTIQEAVDQKKKKIKQQRYCIKELFWFLTMVKIRSKLVTYVHSRCFSLKTFEQCHDDEKHERNVNDLSRYKVNWLYKLYKLRDAAEAKIRNAIHLV